MKNRLLLFLLLISFLLSMNACAFSKKYSQSYITLINRTKVGKVVVNEKVNIKGDVVRLSQQERDTFGSKKKKRMTVKTKMVIPEGKLFPKSYSYVSNTGISYDVKIKDGQIIRTRQNESQPQETVTTFEPGTLMLDLNALHTIDYWIRKYDVIKGGKQTFQTFFPQTASVAKLSITPAQIFIPEHESKELQLRNYEIEVGDKINILLWVDKDNHLYRMFVRGPNIEMIRSDLFDLINKKKEQSDAAIDFR